jgi:hypothetical protein
MASSRASILAIAVPRIRSKRAGGLMPQPQPRELNHDPASLGVTSLTDTLITARLAAPEMRRRQTDVARQLFAIVK